MAALFEKLMIKDIELKNRIVVSPMCQYSSEDGFANNWHLVHLGSRAVGGAGLIILEATAVSPEGRISPADLGLWKDQHVDKIKEIVEFIHSQGTVCGIQLAHAGRKASHEEPWNGDRMVPLDQGGWQTVAPSAIPFRDDELMPVELDGEGIRKVIADFRHASRRAKDAGFKLLEIHAAHGYLIHQFLSPLSNQRTDEYGGSFDNRIKLLLEILEAVKLEWPAGYPIFVRISATDWVEGGWDETDSVRLSAILKERGVDLIDCSSGGIIPYAKIPAGPGYQVGFAGQIKRETGVLTGAVGFITSAAQANEIIKSKKADLVLLAREFLRNPYFPLHAAAELGVQMDWPLQYERGKPRESA